MKTKKKNINLNETTESNEVVKLNEMLTSKDAEIEILEKSKNEIEAKVIELNETITAKDTSIESLNSEIEALKAENLKLNETIETSLTVEKESFIGALKANSKADMVIMETLGEIEGTTAEEIKADFAKKESIALKLNETLSSRKEIKAEAGNGVNPGSSKSEGFKSLFSEDYKKTLNGGK